MSWLKAAHAHQQAGRFEEALGAYRHLLEAEPTHPRGWADLGGLLMIMDRLEEAAESCLKALRFHADQPEALINLGCTRLKQGELWEAEGLFRRVLASDPSRLDARVDLAECLFRKGDLEETRKHLQKVLQQQPDHFRASNKLIHLYCHMGDLEAMDAEVDRYLGVTLKGAELEFERSLRSLQRGEMPLAWESYEARLRIPDRRVTVAGPFAEPLWEGQPFPGKTLLLHWEQGFGDTLMFIRYTALAKALGGQVVVLAQPALVDLVATCPGVDLAIAQGQPLPAFDYHLPLLSLPRVFKTRMDSIPAEIPYLDIPQRVPNRAELGQVLSPSGGRTRIGLAWSGTTAYANLRNRTVDPEHLVPLDQLQGVAWYSFQIPAVEAPPVPSMPLEPLLSNFSDTAYALSWMDLVITVDTALAHAAGAMGIPTLLLLPYYADWRWFMDRTDSPWYPSMQLYRQPKPGDWSPVIQQVLADLGGG